MLVYLLKCSIVMVIVQAVAANVMHNYIKAIDDLVAVGRSNTCVILVIDGAIQFVVTEDDAHNILADYSNIASNKRLHVQETFEPRDTMDIVHKLSDIGRTRSTFLIYFRASHRHHPTAPEPTDPPQPTINNKNKHHHGGGLFGLAQQFFGGFTPF